MPKLFLKSGFRFFWGKPLRIVLSLLLIVASLIVSGVGLIIFTFDYTDLAKQLYYSEEIRAINGFKIDKYMNFAWRTDGEGAGIISSSDCTLTKAETEELEKQLSAIGQGYFLVRHPQCDYSENTNGAFRLFEYFDLNGYDPDEWDPSLHRLFDEEGNLAPLFTYRSDPFDLEDPPILPWEEERAKEVLTCIAARTFYQSVALYEGDLSDLALFGYELHGRMPENKFEVVIPQSVFNAFSAYGYYDRETGDRAEINSFEDILGKKIEMYGTHEFGKTKIVGVMEIDYEAERVEKQVTPALTSDITAEQIAAGNFREGNLGVGMGPIFSMIVHRSYFDDCIPNSYLTHNYERPGYTSCATVLKWSEPKVRDAYWDIAMEPLRARDIFSLEDTAEEYLGYSGSASVELYYFGQAAVQYEPFVWTAYLSIPFTLLLSAYLVYATLYEKRRRLYIMRCLGMSRKRAAVMLMLPVLVFALLAGILALVGTAAILPTMLSEFQIAYWESVYMVTLPGFTLTPLCASYLLLWPVLSGLIGVGISMASYNSTLRRTERRKK